MKNSNDTIWNKTSVQRRNHCVTAAPNTLLRLAVFDKFVSNGVKARKLFSRESFVFGVFTFEKKRFS